MSRIVGRLSLVLVAALVLLSATGCWDIREIENLGLAVTMGIDRAPGSAGYTVTAGIALPSRLQPQSGGGLGGGSAGGGRPGGGPGQQGDGQWTVTGTGPTIADAYRSIQESSPRRLFSGYLQLVVIGEELARQGISPVLEFLERNREVRHTINILVAPGSAQTIVKLSPKTEGLVALYIRGAQRWERFVATGFVTPLRLISTTRSSEGKQILCGRITATSGIQQTNPGEPPSEEYPGVGPSGSGQTAARPTSASTEAGGVGLDKSRGDRTGSEKSEVLLSGSAAFKRDRLVGWLNRRETRGYLLITNRPFMGMVTVKLPSNKKVQVSASTHQVHTRWRVRMEAERPVVELATNWSGGIEQLTGNLDLSKPESVPEVERAIEASLAADMRSALSKAQKELKTDVFGFGRALYEAETRAWKRLRSRWDEVYPTAEVRVTVKARLRRVGVLIDPLRPQ